MARYGQWRRLSGDTDSPALLDAGKKLLGALDEQRKLGGVATLASQVTLEDGSVVRARFAGDQPIIEIQAARRGSGAPSCDLLLESGGLHLTPAASWTSILDLPVIDDTAPNIALQRTGPSCGPLAPYGRVQVRYGTNGQALGFGTVGCTFTTGDTQPSRTMVAIREGSVIASRQDKLNAQARLPPKLWTGLMRRYVAALYGSAAAYRPVADAQPVLRLPCPSEPAGWIDIDYRWGATWGLVDLDGQGHFRFVVATSAGLEVRGSLLRTPCAVSLWQLWRAMAVDTLDQRTRRDRIEAYVLSQLRIGPVVQTLPMTAVAGAPFAYGWHFDRDGRHLAVVARNGAQTQLHRRTLALVGGAVTVADADEAVADFKASAEFTFAGQVYAAGLDNRSASLAALASHAAIPDNWDCPLYCYFQESDAALVVFRSKHTLGATGPAVTTVAGACSYQTFIQSQDFDAGIYTGAESWVYSGKAGIVGGGFVPDYEDIEVNFANPPNTGEYLRATRRAFKAAMLVLPIDAADQVTVRVRELAWHRYIGHGTTPSGYSAGTLDVNTHNVKGILRCGSGEVGTSAMSPDGQDEVITGVLAGVLDRAPPCVSVPIDGYVGATTLFQCYSFTLSTNSRWLICDPAGVPAHYGVGTVPYYDRFTVVGALAPILQSDRLPADVKGAPPHVLNIGWIR